jgi:mannitol/fructose-specific phosphotransferase system IIA component (Ntr-type)
MNLTDMLNLNQFVPRIAANDRWGVIDALVDSLVSAGKIRSQDRDAVRKAVRDREASKSTGIGYGIAMPHASVPCVQDAVAIVARLQPSVDFQALDEQPVRLCVLLITPQGQFQRHLQTLAAFARFLSDKDRRARLENAQTAEEMYAVFQTAAV